MSDINMDLEKKEGDALAEEFQNDEPVKALWHDEPEEEKREDKKEDKEAESFFGSMDTDTDLEKPSFLRRLKRNRSSDKDDKKDEKS